MHQNFKNLFKIRCVVFVNLRILKGLKGMVRSGIWVWCDNACMCHHYYDELEERTRRRTELV
jgi:hypothetical protein